ncbi:50S ribosomal protein L23 [Clostridia bacterium]|nr:50S ribosomal protein L23 [Clostridia bacterium]
MGSVSKAYEDIILKPIITEQSAGLLPERKYTFKVAKSANKIEIRKAVEGIFGVSVEKVNTLNVRGRTRRRGRIEGATASWKKAVVKVTADSKEIEFFRDLM